MVTEFGMSEAIGPINHEGRRRGAFLDAPFQPERGAYAEDTARTIDAEVKRFVESAEALASRILTERRHQLEALSALLLDKEVIEGAELRTLLGVTAQP